MGRGRVLGLACSVACLAGGEAGAQEPLTVQGTTDVRDAGLLEEIIIPGFAQAHPEYSLRFIAVGTGQAIANARAGQGDALVTHAPPLERQFIADGFSFEPFRRAVFYSDYVIPGPVEDPAAVGAQARHDAVRAFELIAAAGEQGRADFVSRGDNSGTNVKEKEIWALARIPRNVNGEPGAAGGVTTASWYHKAGLGQSDTVRLAEQCPFPSGHCYEITDRGTFNRLTRNRAISRLRVVAERNVARARGGRDLLVNSFSGYAVNPAKVPQAKLRGALAFLGYLGSEAFQARLATYPDRAQPAFLPDARPVVALERRLPRRRRAASALTVAGTVAPRLPGERRIAGQLGQPAWATGARVSLVRLLGRGRRLLARVAVRPDGGFRLRSRLRSTSRLALVVPRHRDRLGVTLELGRVVVVGQQ